jgi:hypothetical protein
MGGWENGAYLPRIPCQRAPQKTFAGIDELQEEMIGNTKDGVTKIDR